MEAGSPSAAGSHAEVLCVMGEADKAWQDSAVLATTSSLADQFSLLLSGEGL